MHKKSFFVPGLSSICFKVSYSVLAQEYETRNRYLTSNNSERRSHELLLDVKCRSKKRSLFAGLTVKKLQVKAVLAQKYGYRNRYLTSNNSERRSHELLLDVKCRSKKRSLFAGLTVKKLQVKAVLAQKYGYRNRYLTSNNSERRSHELLLDVKCRSKKRSLFAGLTGKKLQEEAVLTQERRFL